MENPPSPAQLHKPRQSSKFDERLDVLGAWPLTVSGARRVNEKFSQNSLGRSPQPMARGLLGAKGMRKGHKQVTCGFPGPIGRVSRRHHKGTAGQDVQDVQRMPLRGGRVPARLKLRNRRSAEARNSCARPEGASMECPQEAFGTSARSVTRVPCSQLNTLRGLRSHVHGGLPQRTRPSIRVDLRVSADSSFAASASHTEQRGAQRKRPRARLPGAGLG
jgi:hypothetical protein